jgi:hypothetical protein
LLIAEGPSGNSTSTTGPATWTILPIFIRASPGLTAGNFEQFFVMLPWRSLLYSSCKSPISDSALSVAFFIETIRALCSLALALSSAKYMTRFR